MLGHMQPSTRPVGELLRAWRNRRCLSQLDLALEAENSTRHLSFVETGRSLPSRDMVLHLAERLDVPLRERNVLLHAAGYAPVYPKRPLADPALESGRKAVELLLRAHEPYPALAVDRHWTLVAANDAVARLLGGADQALLRPPVNVLRLSLHPAGLAPRIANLVEWRSHLLARLRQQIDASADPVLIELMEELRAYPVSDRGLGAGEHDDTAAMVVPLRLATDGGTLNLFSATTVFGTPVDVTLAEIALETFFPADAATADALRRAAPALPRQ